MFTATERSSETDIRRPRPTAQQKKIVKRLRLFNKGKYLAAVATQIKIYIVRITSPTPIPPRSGLVLLLVVGNPCQAVEKLSLKLGVGIAYQMSS